jgi:SAM-dependent methyltransferase
MTLRGQDRDGGAKASAGWGAGMARSWVKWFDVIEGGGRPLSELMVERAALAAGQRVLDVASGLGEPALTAARRVGPQGRVLATDLSPEMLSAAAKRAESLGLSHVDFRVVAAEDLELPAAGFDAVLCRWGLMFMDDLPRVLAGFHRILRPGGRFVAAVWPSPERAPSISLSARVVRAHLGLPPPEEGAHTPFALKDVDGFRQTVAAAGFVELVGEEVPVTYAFESIAAFVEFRKDRSGILNAAIADFPEDAQDAAWQAVGEAARRFRQPDGRVVMTNIAYCLTARR